MKGLVEVGFQENEQGMESIFAFRVIADVKE